MKTIRNSDDDTRLTGLQYLSTLANIARWWDGNWPSTLLEYKPVVKS